MKKVTIPALCLWFAAFVCSALTISPSARVQRAGDHLAFLASPNGVSVSAWQWQFDGTNLAGQTSSNLSLTNIQLSNAGTYSVIATPVSGSNLIATATLSVSSAFLPLASSNLVVTRIGDGLQSLNTNSGNTLYLDQFSTNGSYVSTVMIPDSGTSALIVEGSGSAFGLAGSDLALSLNQQYLNFAGYNQSLPNSGVTFTGSSIPRAVGAVDGFGVYTLCLTNTGLYNGSAGQIRAAVSVDGDVNTFWTSGIASAATTAIKILTPSQGATGILSCNAGNDPRALVVFGGNLWVSSGNNNASQAQGLYCFSGLPSGSPSTTAALNVSTGSGSDPNDFAFSPDGLTVYIADDDNFTASSGAGGVERWDYNGSNWVFNYTLSTGAGNWGARGLTVDFSRFSGGGPASSGAVVYATTAESSTNRLIQIIDVSGAGSTATVLAAAGGNQLFRVVKFGPVSSPPSAGESDMDDLSVKSYGAKGDGVTDDTAAFKNALAAGQFHNGVYVPMGKYVISSSLTLSVEEMVGRLAGGWPADTMPMPTLLLRVTSGPGLIMNAGASLHGIALLYDQAVPTSSNAPAISLRGNGVSLSSVRIQNPYDGINTYSTSTPGRPRFSDIYIVSPVHMGLEVSRSYDYNQFHHIEVRCPNAMSAGAAFVLDRMDEGSYTGLLASNCLIGLEFDNDPSVSPAGGNFTGNLIGCTLVGCSNCISINGPHKIKITGGSFSSSGAGAVVTAVNELTLVGGQWQTASGPAIQIFSGTNVIVRSSMFSRPAALAAPLVTADNCFDFTLTGCQFLPGSTGLQLGSNVSRAIVAGDSFEDGGISNLMTSSLFVIGTNLITASAPSGLVALAGAGQVTLNWAASVQAANYNVKRSLICGGPYVTLASPSGTNYTDIAVSNGVTYYYVVSALRPSGESANSGVVSATPQTPNLTVSFSSGSNQLNLAWPGWAYNLTLYMTTNLTPPPSWQPVTNAPSSNNGVFNLSLPTTNNAGEFFQLGPP